MRKLVLIFILLVASSSAQNIYTFAGTGFLGYTPDGNSAMGNQIGNPFGMCADNLGNIYFVEGNTVIRKVNSSGILSTVAGASTFGLGFSGDGGPATSAQLNYPEGIAIDGSGNIYIADQMNNRIRKIDASGIINTIAGTGTVGYSGDGGPATSAQISYPIGITVDLSGNIYFTEQGYGYDRIRKINSSGIISTIAGNGTAGYSGDGGPASAALVNTPVGITTDAAGNVYFSDSLLHTVRKINTSGIISKLASIPVRNIVSDATGNIYCTYKDIKKINTLGVISTAAGNGTPGYSGDGGPATSAQVVLPYGITLDQSNNIYFGQQGQTAYNQCIRVVCQNSCFAGVLENKKDLAEISIFPNPTAEELNIKSTIENEKLDLVITNIMGKVVSHKVLVLNGSSGKLDLNLANGIYFITVNNQNKESITKKLVVAR